ncbi:hypothetical protein BH09MYX1_BH09MYX1_03630 [soil metagenome]
MHLEPNVTTTWSPPAEFDEFVIERPLGRGGMGLVFLGRDVALDRRVALKFIAQENPSASARERFVSEARAIAKLSHRNVVGIFRIGEADAHPYLAYELVDGESLDKIAKPLGWESTLRVLVGLARGLAAAHASHVVHRDVKPANVMLSAQGEIKLFYFGLAKIGDPDVAPGATQRPPSIDPITDRMRTRPGAIVGTPAYMAPELLEGASASTRSDVYALGVLAYELLVGVLPLDDEPVALITSIANGSAARLRTAREDVPESLVEIVERCLRADPAERFASAEAVCHELEALERVFLPRTHGIAPLQIDPDRVRVSQSMVRLRSRVTPMVSALYARLFAHDPELRSLFPEDLTAQQEKLGHMLQLTIDGLAEPEKLAPVLEDLGRRHVSYGVTPLHFEALRKALLASLAEYEGAAWDLDLEYAWRRAFGFIEASMRRGMTPDPMTLVTDAS